MRSKTNFGKFTIVLLILTGCALYPMGWANQEMRDICGSMPYELGMFVVFALFSSLTVYLLGTCQLSLSAYLLGFGLIALLVCILFGLISTRKLSNYTTKYDNLVILNRH